MPRFQVLINTPQEGSERVAEAVAGEVCNSARSVRCTVDAACDLEALETVHAMLGVDRGLCGTVRVWQNA